MFAQVIALESVRKMSYCQTANVERHWDRLRVSQSRRGVPEKNSHSGKRDRKCIVDFALNAEVGCSLGDQDEPQQNIPEVLRVIETVAKFRFKHPMKVPAERFASPSRDSNRATANQRHSLRSNQRRRSAISSSRQQFLFENGNTSSIV